MDPLLPRLEDEERRRRRRLLFRQNKIPVRMLVPNFFTILSLCAGLTAIRMAIEQRYEMAIALVVIAAALDGVDGRKVAFIVGDLVDCETMVILRELAERLGKPHVDCRQDGARER